MHGFASISAASLIFLAACTTPEPVKTANAATGSESAPAKKVIVSGSRIPQDANVNQIGVSSGTYNPMPH